MSKSIVENWVQSVTDTSKLLLEREKAHGWLIRQSIYTHFQRLIPLLSLSCLKTITGSILDVGAGTGALTIDLAWRAGTGASVTALDHDTEALKIAETIAKSVGVRIKTLAGDATALPVKDASQDMTVARFLFQHLPDPSSVLSQMRRATRPGGRIVLIDVDDGFLLTDQPELEHTAALRKAIRTLQSQHGGNRLIGRQLYRLMRDVGLEEIQVLMIPLIRLGLQQGRIPELEAFRIERLLMYREELIGSGIMTSQDFDAAVSEFVQGFAQDRFEIDGEIVATGLAPV